MLEERHVTNAGDSKGRFGVVPVQAGGECLHGRLVDGFALAIVDEAHSTQGDLGRPWAAMLRPHPADFRLYLTATPRILVAPRPLKGTDGKELEIATMATATTRTGRTARGWPNSGLSGAIERGILPMARVPRKFESSGDTGGVKSQVRSVGDGLGGRKRGWVNIGGVV